MIELTVGLPIFNNRDIAWLCLESLCNQKNIYFEWELLICEETKYAFGPEGIKPFVERLKKVGCAKCTYVPIDYRVVLAEKWRYLGNLASKTSKTFVFCASDDYYEPFKLKKAYDAVRNGYDWIHYRYCLMYNILEDKEMYFDCKSIGRDCGNILATTTENMRNLPKTDKYRGVDGWLYSTIKPQNDYLDESDDWALGFATDGANTLSITRRNEYRTPKPPFFSTDIRISKLLKPYIYKKLINLGK